MARVNPTEFAILGLLAEAPRSGYDIKRDVEERLSHFWSESYGHIYPMLRRLHNRGLVLKEVEQQEGRPDRKVYQITESGRQALEDWFARPPPPLRPRNELLLRIFLGRHARYEHLVRDVEAFGRAVQNSLDRLRTVQERIEAEGNSTPDRVYWDLVLDYGVTALDALAGWSRNAKAKLQMLDEGTGEQ